MSMRIVWPAFTRATMSEEEAEAGVLRKRLSIGKNLLLALG